jgi:hypothetical protein
MRSGIGVLHTKGPPEAAHMLCFDLRRDGAGKCKRPALWVPGAIPTVDFLLHHFGAVVKKVGVKSQDCVQRKREMLRPIIVETAR